jgi:UDPglucose 6-dehydrogenase
MGCSHAVQRLSRTILRPGRQRVAGSVTGFSSPPSPYHAATDASALVIVTEWLQYRTPDFDRIRDAMARPLIIDGRNLWEPRRMKEGRLRVSRDRTGGD